MRGKRIGQGMTSGWVYSLLLAVFFFLGVLAGTVCAGRAGEHVGEELSAYLSVYLEAARQGDFSVSAVFALALAYVWGAALAFLGGFFPAGPVLLPLLTAAYGFFPAYAVSCLTAAFGGQGLWLALGFFGFRCLVSVPCFFLLAVPAWRMAAGRLRASVERRNSAPAAGRGCLLRFAGVLLALAIGVCLDLRLSPWLLRALLTRVF